MLASRQLRRSAVLPWARACSSYRPQLRACWTIASGEVPPIESMPIPCLPAASAPVGEREAATASSITGWL